ncbi:AMP-binding protein [Nocardia beijingensis]|uniref:class I adenylate-forming enzyme family protein n=1 Tax=Nocardia beijingensis TaxID=95162 RepID=UPI00189391C6|nr:AMP-binding protein [Nocardia beijingensis]MBF6469994.1 AMP-binding protein [Nocardia beijingensis]
MNAESTVPPWPTIGALLRDAAHRHGSREFLRFPQSSLSFADVDQVTDHLASTLIARGLRPGDRVAIMMENVADWPLSWFAIVKSGGIAVPVNARYQESDLAFVLRDSGASLVLTTTEYVALIRSVVVDIATVKDVLTLPALSMEMEGISPDRCDVAVESSDLANLQYTSGTTGFPKACMLTHDYWLRTAWSVSIHAELSSGDVVMMAQAFSYMDPQWTALMCLMVGTPLVMLPRFSASGFWRSAREHGATVTYVLGTMPLLLFKQPPNPSDRDNHMRLVLCSGIPRDLHASLEQRWGARWREIYGSTETGLDLIVPPDADETVGTGAMGHPPLDKEVQVADDAGTPRPVGEVGEILVRGRPMMEGYWNHPGSTDHAFRGGWFHTGDLGYIDDSGWIHHAGRLKDVIRRGGENISAAEVENVLEQHSAVLASAVIAIPDELFGELPMAFVLLRAGRKPDADTALDIVGHALRSLAKFKIPAYLVFRDKFPMTPSARIQKTKLLTPGTDPRSGAFNVATGSWT